VLNNKSNGILLNTGSLLPTVVPLLVLLEELFNLVNYFVVMYDKHSAIPYFVLSPYRLMSFNVGVKRSGDTSYCWAKSGHASCLKQAL